MEFISGIVWRNLNKATFDTLNNRSPGQYDIRLGSADYSAFFDGLPRENATNIGGFSLTVPLTSFPTADTGASTPLVVRYMGNDSASAAPRPIPSGGRTAGCPTPRQTRAFWSS